MASDGGVELPLAHYVVTYGGPALLFCLGSLLLGVTGRRLLQSPSTLRAVGLVLVWLLMAGVLTADLWRDAREARRRCALEAGLHVTATAQAAGFIAPVDFPPYAALGFAYLERDSVGMRRYFMREGREQSVALDTYSARYEVTEDTTPLSPALTRWRKQMRDRSSGEVLGAVVAFRLYPGWVDRAFGRVLGTPLPLVCVDGVQPPAPASVLDEGPLIRATLRPEPR